MRACLLVFALALAGCIRSAEQPASPDASPIAESASPTRPPSDDPDAPAVLTADGWGPLRIGMTRQEVIAAAGDDANPDAVGGSEPEQCDEFRPSRAPEGMLVMIEQGRLTRISVSDGARVTTEEDFAVGDAASVLKAAYGDRAEVTPHKYVPAPAEYLTVWQTDPSGTDARGIVYEVGPDARVAHIHAGGPSIQYVEGCL